MICTSFSLCCACSTFFAGDSHFVDHPGSGVRAGSTSIGRLTPVSGRETVGIGEGDSDEEQTEGEEWAAYEDEDVRSLSSIVNGHVS